jgi:NAD(P)H-hydrate epimerase
MKAVSLTPALVKGWLPRRRAETHKGDVGHVLVAAGSRGMMGAARLCALGALRSGAGLVTLAVPDSQYAVAAASPREAMVLPLPDQGGAFHPAGAEILLKFIKTRRVTAVALGPGLSTRPGPSRFALTLLEKSSVPVVADADALNVLAERRAFRRRGPWVLTPHPGEAGRLLGKPTAAVQKDRPAAVRALAERFGAVAALKGAGTLVSDGMKIYENGTGNPGMASGGMGDVLTGIVAGLMGQVRAASPAEACFRAAAAGVHLHGRAGDRAARELGPVGFAASDLADRLPAVFKALV